MRRYPIPSPDWLAQNPISKRLAIDELSDVFDVLRDDRRFERTFNNLDDYYVESMPSDFLNGAFAVALTYLLLRWQDLPEPFAALEDLVTDFRGADTIWSGDGMLPESVAGISALLENSEQASAELSERYRNMVRDYARSLAEDGWIAKLPELQ